MKLSGTAALHEQKKQLQAALAITDKQIALAEELSGEVKPEKKARRKRMPKQGQWHEDGTAAGSWVKPNGAEEHAE